MLNDTLAWDIDRNRDNTTCLDIDPDTLYALPYVREAIVSCKDQRDGQTE